MAVLATHGGYGHSWRFWPLMAVLAMMKTHCCLVYPPVYQMDVTHSRKELKDDPFDRKAK
jgi:hypothetical protein